MLTVRDYISINRNLIRKYQRAVRHIDEGKFKFDGSMPQECVRPMYESKIARLTAENEYLRRFAPEHVLTSDEAYKCRAIINGKGDL